MFRQNDQSSDNIQSLNIDHNIKLSSYPLEMSSFLISKYMTFDAMGVPYHLNSTKYHPNTIVQYALSYWNHYLANRDREHLNKFLAQSKWLIEHEIHIGEDAGGWPISFGHPDIHTNGSWLSALTQGYSLSVLTRAYTITQERAFLEVANRAVRSFELDILDGGVSSPVGEKGIFFEEVAIYPAAHRLSGFIVALIGLYDYVAITGNPGVYELIQQSLSTFHFLLDEFNLGFWTRDDLLHRNLASPQELTLQIALLEVLAQYSGCDHYLSEALRWKNYQSHLRSRIRYLITNGSRFFGGKLLNQIRSIFFHKPQVTPVLRVCVPITAFPVTGGMRTVLTKIAQVTSEIWQMEYLTQNVGPDSEKYVIHRFGTSIMAPWQFPIVWLYFLAGCRKLISLMLHGADYNIILPQDGVFTGAFGTLVAKLVGVRTVYIDHGDLGLLKSPIFHDERIKTLAKKHWLRRTLAHFQFTFYWPSLHLFALLAARCADQVLIPGAAGDGVEEICRQLGVPQSRITRFANMINIERHEIPDATKRAQMREKIGIDRNAIVIIMVCRLAPEKGLDIAIESISRAISTLSPILRAQVRMLLVGDGPLRKQLEEDIRMHGLSQTCILWGEASEETIISLLGLSDIFLFTSRRAAGYPLAILEAMASACAVIASAEPLANIHMLADERGIVVPVGDIEQTSAALRRLLNDLTLCRRIGSQARDYVAVNHNANELRRPLIRVTYWSALNELLDSQGKI